MSQPARKRLKADNTLSSIDQLLEQLAIEPPRLQEQEKVVLFRKSVTLDDETRNQSYYAKLRYWFYDGVPKTDPEPLCQNVNAFLQMPAPLPTRLSPYPTQIPFLGEGFSQDIIDDTAKLLQHHKAHWKRVRQDWNQHRQLYLKRYQPCLDVVQLNCTKQIKK